jgi:hypothetical protein
MVLSWEKEEGAGAKEKRSKGEENSGTSTTPPPKTQFMKGGRSMQVKDNKRFVQQSMCTYSKHKPRKSTVF